MRSWTRKFAAAVLVAGCLVHPSMVDAQDNPPVSAPGAKTAYEDAAGYQNNGAFELAAETWSRLLKDYPNDPLASKARHYLGVCRRELKQYAEAEQAFQEVIRKYPEFAMLEDSFLNLAWCRYLQGIDGNQEKLQQSIQAFADFLERFPEAKLADEATYYRGEALYALGNRQDAVTAYAKVVTGYPESKLRCDAMYALGVTYEEMSQFDAAGKVYDRFLTECAESPQVTEVRMRKAETVLQTGDAAGAEKMFGEIAASADFDRADHALYRQAFCAARQDAFQRAGQLYASMASRFPQSSYLPNAMMAAGRSFYRGEQFPDAAQAFQWLRQNQHDPTLEAAHWLCRIHLRSGQAAEALQLANQALEGAANAEFAGNLKMDRGDALFELPEQRPAALAAFREIADQHPQSELAAAALYNAAFTALDLHQYPQSLELADQFLERYPEDRLLPDVSYVRAECRFQMREYPAAEKDYQQLIQEYPEHSDAAQFRLRQALSIYLQQEYERLIATLQPQLDNFQQPQQKAEAEFLVGAGHFYLDQFDDAARNLRASMLTSAAWRQADETMLYLSRAQRKLNQLDAAVETIKLLLANFPESQLLDQAYYRLGEYRYAQNDFPAALDAYQTILERWKDSQYAPFAQFGKGWSLLKSGKYEPATQTFNQLVEQYPEHQLANDAVFARGMCYRQTGDLDSAIRDLQFFLDKAPAADQAADAQFELGLAQAAAKEHPAAIATLRGLLENHPQYAAGDRVLYEIGWAIKLSDSDPAAATEFAKLTKQYPDSGLAAEAHFHVGEDLYNRGEFAAAVTEYAQAQQKARTGEVGEKSDYKCGWAYYQQKKYDQALKQFEHQVQTYADGPLLADGLFMRSECQFQLNQYEPALEGYQQLRELPVSSPQIAALIRLHGGQSAAQQKDWAGSVSWLNELVEKFPESPLLIEACYERGWALKNLGKADEAVEDFERAATQSRDEVGARAMFMIGEIEFARKDYEQAIKQFRRLMFRYGNDQVPDAIRNWQAKAGYEAGRCCEVQIQTAAANQRAKLIEDAKFYYNYVTQQHPQNELAATAKQRLEALARL